MKYLLTILFFGLCGTPPTVFKPLGCKTYKPICVCDEDGNCDWQYQCEY